MGALLSPCGGHLDYPQMLGASGIVSCEVMTFCLSKPLEMLVKLFQGHGMVLMT